MGLLDSLRKAGSKNPTYQTAKNIGSMFSGVFGKKKPEDQGFTPGNFERLNADFNSGDPFGPLSNPGAWPSPSTSGQPVDVSGLPLSHPTLPIAPNSPAPAPAPAGGLRAAAQASYQPMGDSFGNSFSGSDGGMMGISRDTGGTDMGDLVRNGFMPRALTTDNDPEDSKSQWRSRQSMLSTIRNNS